MERCPQRCDLSGQDVFPGSLRHEGCHLRKMKTLRTRWPPRKESLSLAVRRKCKIKQKTIKSTYLRLNQHNGENLEGSKKRLKSEQVTINKIEEIYFEDV